MIAWVIYDIKKDKPRTKVHKLCKQSGLYHVQYSTFLGTIDDNKKDTLQLRINELIDPEEDRVYIFTMNKSELKQCVLLGQAFDKKLITDEVKALFF
jgi:CRISPR-associated protein Cas2